MDAPHISLMCSKLERVESGACRRLIVNIPPGYAKSHIFSRVFASWFLMRNPRKEFGLLSYGDSLAEEHSRAARGLFDFWSPQITGYGMSKDTKAVNRWTVGLERGRSGGGMLACGIGSSVTGRRFDIGLVDDPFKSLEDAGSEVGRERVWDFYRSVFRSRLRKDGAIVVVQTRWDKQDLSGKLLKMMDSGGREQWEVLKFPALALEDDVLGRAPGDPLWPDMYSLDDLLDAQDTVGPFLWAAQFQQEPESAEGKLFKRAWLLDFDVEGDHYVLHGRDGDLRYHKGQTLVFQTVDTNGSASTSSDYFVVSTWAVCPDCELLLLGVFRDRIGVQDHLSALQSEYVKWSPAYQCVENRTFGTNLIAAGLAVGLPIVETPADVDKVTRSTTMMAKYKSGRVYHRFGAAWRDVVDGELLEFPGGRHDDFVDTASDAGIQSVLLGGSLLEAPRTGGKVREGFELGLYEDWVR
jgi:hypothetical protein